MRWAPLRPARIGCPVRAMTQSARGENAAPSAAVVHVIAEERSLADDTPVQLDGETPRGPDVQALARDDARRGVGTHRRERRGQTNPAVVNGGGIMPAPLLAAKVANTATVRPLGSSWGRTARAALHTVTPIGRLRPLSRSHVPVPRL